MQNKVNRFLERLLTVFIKERDREALLSDFEEIYLDIADERGKSAANAWYVSQILRSIPLPQGTVSHFRPSLVLIRFRLRQSSLVNWTSS